MGREEMTVEEFKQAVAKEMRGNGKAATNGSKVYAIGKGICEELGLPVPEAEFRFKAERKWKVDFFFPFPKSRKDGLSGIGLEINGGVWASTKDKKSRHFHGLGAVKDMEKIAAMAIAGILFIPVTPQQFASGEALILVQRCWEANKCS